MACRSNQRRGDRLTMEPMEFVGKIVRADGSLEPLYVRNDLYLIVTLYINDKIRTLQDGDAFTLNRTK